MFRGKTSLKENHLGKRGKYHVFGKQVLKTDADPMELYHSSERPVAPTGKEGRRDFVKPKGKIQPPVEKKKMHPHVKKILADIFAKNNKGKYLVTKTNDTNKKKKPLAPEDRMHLLLEKGILPPRSQVRPMLNLMMSLANDEPNPEMQHESKLALSYLYDRNVITEEDKAYVRQRDSALGTWLKQLEKGEGEVLLSQHGYTNKNAQKRQSLAPCNMKDAEYVDYQWEKGQYTEHRQRLKPWFKKFNEECVYAPVIWDLFTQKSSKSSEKEPKDYNYLATLQLKMRDKQDKLLGKKRKLLACALCTLHDDSIHVEYLCASNTCTGAGGKMMECLEKFAKKTGRKYVTLHSIKSATGFYKKANYAFGDPVPKTIVGTNIHPNTGNLLLTEKNFDPRNKYHRIFTYG